ncbi:MAG: hypothetical protein M1401_02535 [Chloroflexi bacterium]|nr:hypothetical protein [Chloroflexota bacterium]MCL5107752.1 hypothetical protein [Chloroflexota bacterium]
MNVMRYTVVDARGTVSFVAGCESLVHLVAACSASPRTLAELLHLAGRYDPRLEEYVTSGLAVFDEHNVDGHNDSIHSALRYCQPHELPVFRVVDDETREASLQRVKAGILIFNLKARRIVQLLNAYQAIQRKGRVVVTEGREKRVYRYELPQVWAIVP